MVRVGTLEISFTLLDFVSISASLLAVIMLILLRRGGKLEEISTLGNTRDPWRNFIAQLLDYRVLLIFFAILIALFGFLYQVATIALGR